MIKKERPTFWETILFLTVKLEKHDFFPIILLKSCAKYGLGSVSGFGTGTGAGIGAEIFSKSEPEPQ